MGRRTGRRRGTFALLLVASLGSVAWLCHEPFEAYRAADAFMAGLAGDVPAAVPEAFRRRAVGTVDWDVGFRRIRTRDRHERLSRQGFIRDVRSGEERWFKLTLQRHADSRWCVLALSVDAAARRLQ